MDTSELRKQAGERKMQRIGLKPMPTEEQYSAICWYRKWMMSGGYSENTINTYCSLLENFFLFVKEKPVRDVMENDVINFNSDFIVGTKKSDSYQRQCINAIKLFYAQINGHRLDTQRLERVKRAKTLPTVLSLDETKALINSYTNLKHKALVVLTYACGLRRSETINLKKNDTYRKAGKREERPSGSIAANNPEVTRRILPYK